MKMQFDCHVMCDCDHVTYSYVYFYVELIHCSSIILTVWLQSGESVISLSCYLAVIVFGVMDLIQVTVIRIVTWLL
jgi:hypothetical protein